MWLKSSTVIIEKPCETTIVNQNISICQGENYIFNNQAYNQTGTYEATFIDTNSCDSIVTLNLTVLPNITTELTAEITEGENYIFNNQTYNQTGNYQATFTATNGCDSIVDLQLTVLPKSAIETNITETICEGNSFEGYSQTGTYIDTFNLNNASDSIRRLELIVNSNILVGIGAVICQGENYILNNQTYNQTGNYETTFTATNGCDSIVQLTLEILPVPIAIADTFSIKENQELIVDITQNDVLLANINWQTSVITPPPIGTLTSLGNGQFSYLPRFAYTGPTFFEYQICNETCLPEGCTTAKVLLNIQGEQVGKGIDPIPLPPTFPIETSKVQLENPFIQEGELVIFNIYGQVVEKRYFFKDAQKQLWNLQQNELSSGIYFYIKRVKGNNEILESGKIIAVGR